MRVPLLWSLVTYEANSRLGYIMAWISLVPIFLVFIQIGIIIAKRGDHLDKRTIALLILGQICNELLNNIIKRNLKLSRPFRIICAFNSDHYK